MWFSLLIWSIWKRGNLPMLQMKYRELVRGLFVSWLIYFSASARPLSLFLSPTSLFIFLFPHGDRVIWRSVEGSKKGSSLSLFFLSSFPLLHSHAPCRSHIMQMNCCCCSRELTTVKLGLESRDIREEFTRKDHPKRWMRELYSWNEKSGRLGDNLMWMKRAAGWAWKVIKPARCDVSMQTMAWRLDFRIFFAPLLPLRLSCARQ